MAFWCQGAGRGRSTITSSGHWCPALQWGHCEVPVHEAVSEGCAECTLCRQQQREQAAAWAGMSGFPADAWRQSAAPAWVDRMAGDASWVVKEADVKVLVQDEALRHGGDEQPEDVVVAVAVGQVAAVLVVGAFAWVQELDDRVEQLRPDKGKTVVH